MKISIVFTLLLAITPTLVEATPSRKDDTGQTILFGFIAAGVVFAVLGHRSKEKSVLEQRFVNENSSHFTIESDGQNQFMVGYTLRF